jgi:hypothetical protein
MYIKNYLTHLKNREKTTDAELKIIKDL